MFFDRGKSEPLSRHRDLNGSKQQPDGPNDEGIYGREKTVADCFKYRNKIGLDVAIEALRLWKKRKGSKVEPLMKMARICRVESVMRPYVESVL